MNLHPLLQGTNNADSQSMMKLFATPIFRHKINDVRLIKELTQEVLSLKDQAKSGSADTWCTDDNLHTLPAFKTITEIILAESNKIFDRLTLERNSQYIAGMWSNVSKVGRAHQTHVHPNSFYSGVMYLQVPEGAGNLFFGDPRQCSQVIVPVYKKPNPELTGSNFQVRSEEGMMYMFPSWLPHGVLPVDYKPNLPDRISIAFNVMIKADISLHSAKWSLT
jgi:uncharacterized protein (TIGR02466 family)